MITIKDLENNQACEEGLKFAKKHSTLLEAWNRCERSDWLWWAVRKFLKPTREQSIEYANRVKHRVKHKADSDEYARVFVYTAAATDADAAYDAAHDARNSSFYADSFEKEQKWQCAQIRDIIKFNG